MKTAVVTGANGFIGKRLVKRLLDRGTMVYGVGRHFNEGNFSVNNFRPIELEFQQYSQMEKLIPEREIDAFYHFAWGGGFERETLKNYSLQLENAKAAGDAVMSAIQLKAKRFIYAGTINEVETQQFINSFESFQTRPTCIYAAAKLTSELICRTLAQENQLHYCAGLIPMVFGEGNRSKQLVNVVLNSLLSGKEPKLIEGNNQYDIVHVEDVARAFQAIGECGVDGRRYYIGHRKLQTFRQWMEQIRDIVSPGMNLRFGGYKDPLDLDYSLLDLNELYNDTGFECQECFSQRMQEYVNWYKRNNCVGA